jgi:hypothetical protein
MVTSANAKSALGATVAIAAVAIGLLGCSGAGELPSSDAASLATQVADVSRRVNAHDCDAVNTQSLPHIEHEIALLPNSVDTDLRHTLADGVDHLQQLVLDQCHVPAPDSDQQRGVSALSPDEGMQPELPRSQTLNALPARRQRRMQTQNQTQIIPRPANGITGKGGDDRGGSGDH